MLLLSRASHVQLYKVQAQQLGLIDLHQRRTAFVASPVLCFYVRTREYRDQGRLPRICVADDTAQWLLSLLSARALGCSGAPDLASQACIQIGSTGACLCQRCRAPSLSVRSWNV